MHHWKDKLDLNKLKELEFKWYDWKSDVFVSIVSKSSGKTKTQ
jgi:hypothetical protein